MARILICLTIAACTDWIPDGFAGSIMDLDPATTYEVRLQLKDPDGVDGDSVKEMTLQPVYAGPVYWIRNVLYNAHKGARAFKLEAGVLDYSYQCLTTDHAGRRLGLCFKNFIRGRDTTLAKEF